MDGVGEYTGDDPRKLEAACTGCGAALVCINTSTEEMGKPSHKQRCHRCGILFVYVLFHNQFRKKKQKKYNCLRVTSRCPLPEYKKEWATGSTGLLTTLCLDCEDYLDKHGGVKKWEKDGYLKTKDFQKNLAKSLTVPDV